MGRVLLIFAILAACYTRQAWTAGAGRAFPVDSENEAIKTFQRINPSVEWDPTNFMTDLSGQYANCNYLNQKGEMKADRKTPEGAEVTVVIDTIEGKDSDVNEVNKYVSEVLRRWESNRMYHGQILKARRVGCSVRPACSGFAVVACVMSDGTGGNGGSGRPDDGRGGEAQFLKGRETEHVKWDGDENNDKKESQLGFIEETPKALAFTKEQYQTAETVMKQKWDRAHFLENLSGFETDCGMIGRIDWPFEFAKKVEDELKIKITGQYGTAVNKGSTPDAMNEILSKFRPVPKAHSIGCSIIPHCRTGAKTMEVVIACLYEEE
jgi:hypothetical protein